MKKYNFFAKSLLLTTVMGFFLAPVALNAQEKVVANLAPQGKWNIRDFKDSQGGANSYCALSRSYDQNLVLSLGRNAIKEYSIAIDFQGRKLNTDKPYAITLQPSPGQIRAYEIMPASANAMVIRLGYDDSFFNALVQSGFLMADIAGDKYRFELSNIEQGREQLNNCLAKIRNEAPVKTATNFKAEKMAKTADGEKEIKLPVEKLSEPTVPMKKVEAVKEEIKEPAIIPKAEKMAEATAPKVVPSVPPPPPEAKLSKAVEREVPRAPQQPAKITSERISSVTTTSMPSVPPVAVAQEKLPVPEKPIAKAPSAPRVVKQIVTESPDPELLNTIAKLKEQNKTLALALNQEQQKPAKIEVRESEINQTAMQQLEELKEQNKQMAANLAAQQTQTQEKEKLAADLAKVEEEKRQLAQTLIEKQEALEAQTIAAAELEKQKAEAQKLAEQAQKKQEEARELAAANEMKKQREFEAQKLAAQEMQAEALKLTELKQSQYVDTQGPVEPQSNSRPRVSRQVELADVEQQQVEQQAVQRRAEDERQAEMQRAEQKLEVEKHNQAVREKAKPAELVEKRVAATPSVDQQLAERRAMEDRERALKDLAKQRAFEEQVITLSNNTSEKEKLAEEHLKRVEAENKKLAMDIEKQQKELESSAKRSEKIDPMVTDKLSDIKSENEMLEETLREQEEKLASFNEKSPQAEADLKSIREEIAILRIENKKLYDEARDARSQIDNVAIKAGEKALDRIREYERKLENAQRDNMQLAREVETLKVEQENISMDVIDGGQALESTGQRYNEAQREIKRLGLLLEQQRRAHIDEKVKLEGMLFDPAVTDKKQREKLAQLERQLSNAQARLGGTPPIQVSVNETFPDRINVYTNSGTDAVGAQRDNIEASRMREKLDRQEQQLQVYQRQNNTAMVPMPNDTQMAAVPRPPVTAQALSNPAQAYGNVPQPIESRPGMVVSAQRPSSPVAQNIQNTLNQAGLTLRNGVSQQADNRYRWAVGNMVGSAEIQNANQSGNIQSFIQMYMTRAQQRCSGDFASLPGLDSNTFEIACISPSRNSSAALLFTRINNDFVAIAHETTADDMDVAMDARDRIAGAL